MSNIFLYNRPLTGAASDFIRATSEKRENTDLHSTDISTFVNDNFVFYIPPPTSRMTECRNPSYYDGFTYKTGGYIISNMSAIQLFAYENGAVVNVEWLNCSVVSGATFDPDNQQWLLDASSELMWMEDIPGSKQVKKKFKLGEYEEKEIFLSDWLVTPNHRIISGVVKITSDNPISVMHHKLHQYGTYEEDGFESSDWLNYNWDGVYSAYGKKLFTRITGDCWLSALEANTNVHVWDKSDKNDDITLKLDRFEGWANCRNSILEQYGFDDDLVLISSDKPVSIVAGMQSDQGFVQIFGKDGRDFHFPSFGYVLVYAPNGGKIELHDKAGNQGTYNGYIDPGEMKIFDFKVAYKMRRYSSYEWAELRSSEPIYVYSFSNSSWYLDENMLGRITGEEYITTYKKITEFYSHGYVPYPASTEFKIPLRSRAYVTVVNLDNSKNDVKVDFSKLSKTYETKMKSYQSLTFDFSEDSYYRMNLINRDTGTREPSKWLFSDPDRRYALDYIPRISLHDDDPTLDKLEHKVSRENITKGSTVTIKASSPVMVLVRYDKDDSRAPLGLDLIPGLSPPAFRGLPEPITWIVIISGMIIAVDAIIVIAGRRSNVEIF